MGCRIVFAPQAHARLAEIVRSIAQDHPQAAIRFGDYLVDRAESLAQFSRTRDAIPEEAERASALV